MLAFPKPRLTKDEVKTFISDPEVLTLEILFVLMTVLNVFLFYRLFTDIIPFPITVAWFQLVGGALFALILGEYGKEFKNCAYFPRFTLSAEKAKELALPTAVYLVMIVLANVLLANTPNVATYPVLLSLAVIFHHVSRSFGCGEIYMPWRWIAIGIMGLGFVTGIFDRTTMDAKVFLLAMAYAVASATYRAWCLEKAMHVVEGKGNQLHNQQVIAGIVALPVLILATGEWRFFRFMPISCELYTVQYWCVLVTMGALPFIKNVVANRLIRKTGQAPWRALEVVSVALVFLVGAIFWTHVGILGILASLLMISGRTVSMFDAISHVEPEPREPKPIKKKRKRSSASAEHSSAPEEPHYDEEEEIEGEGEEPAGDVELAEQSPPKTAEEPVHEAQRPFLNDILKQATQPPSGLFMEPM